MGLFSDKKENLKCWHILNAKEVYHFYLKISKVNEKVNTNFISLETLTAYFDEALNKLYAGQGSVFCVWLFSCHHSMSLAVRKQFLRLNVTIAYNIFIDVYIGAKNHNFNIPLILDK